VRTILHVDMDAFYAAIEQRDDPSLRGRPLIVGGTSGRGVVSTASYEARVFGIRSAMPMVTARRLCPAAIVVPPRMSVYVSVSHQVMKIFESYTPLVEPLSLDEAFLDVTGSRAVRGDGPSIAHAIQRDVEETTRLTASVGVATSKFVAKIASDLEKPRGLVVVQEGDEERFLAPLPISRMWGVGKVTAARLAALGFHTFADLAGPAGISLSGSLGQTGDRIRQLARGQDARPVVPSLESSSIGSESTFETDLRGEEEMRPRLLTNVVEASRRLRARGLDAERITLKVKLGTKNPRGQYPVLTRSRKLPFPSSDEDTLFEEAVSLLRATGLQGRSVRLLGISLSGLVPEGQGQLPLDPALIARREKRARLMDSIDRIESKYGKGAVSRASRSQPEARRPPRSG